jgi:hypothetical protein
VFNGTRNFVVSQGGKSGASAFIFETEDGTISGWSPGWMRRGRAGVNRGTGKLCRALMKRRLAVETWLQRNGVITITQNKKVLPVFFEQFAHN